MAKILVIAGYTPSLLNFRGPLLRHFQQLGYEVVAASPDPDADSVRRLADQGVVHRAFPMQRVGLNPLGDGRTFGALRSLIAAEAPDHVLAYTIKPVIWGCQAARSAGVPHVHALITGLGTAFQTGGARQTLLGGIVALLYRRALSGCETVFFQNPDDRRLFLERGLAEGEQSRLVDGSGIDLEHFARQPVPAGGPYFLLIARLIEEKGIRLYAEAARRIRAEFPAARFRLVGFHEEAARGIPAAEVEAWQQAGSVEYLGPSDDVRPHLAAANVYCLPSYYREGVPRSILEALAVGRAVVTTDAPGCRETVIEGGNGHLVRPRDVESLVEALRKVCREPEAIAPMGAASRRLAEERFDVRRVNEAICRGMGLL